MSDAPPTWSQEAPSTIEVLRPRPGAAQVVITGEHDLESAEALQTMLDDELSTCSRLIVDISPATFIDSSTVNVLVQAKRQADRQGCPFHLVLGTTRMVERTLEICGVLPALNRVKTLNQALSA